MEHNIMNGPDQNTTLRQGMATKNQQPDWNVNPGIKRPSTSAEDKIALFAVPLPSPEKSDYLCLCKRLFWSVGSSYFTAFCPLSPDETRTLPLASTVVQLVCASPASSTDSTGRKRVPHDLLAYNAQGNIIGVPYLSIHKETQLPGTQSTGIPYPDISNSAWVPALNVPFVGSPERQNRERLEDVVFIIRNEKHPSDILHQSGTMPMLFSKEDVKKDSPVLTDGSRGTTANEPVPVCQQGNGLQTESHTALDLSQKDVPTSPKDSKLGNPLTKQRQLLPSPPKTVPSSVAGQSASPIKTNVSAASTSLYRAYNSKWREQQKGLSPTRKVNAMVAKDQDATGSTNEACKEMVLPQIGSVFSLKDCSSPDESLPKRITDALLKNTQSDPQKLPSKTHHTEQPVQTDLSNKESHKKRKDGKSIKQRKCANKKRRFKPRISPPLEQDITYRQSAATVNNAPHKPIRPSCETVRQNAHLKQSAALTSTIQCQLPVATVQPEKRTIEKIPTGNFTETDRQSSHLPTSLGRSPLETDQLGHNRPLQQTTSLGSREMFPKEVLSKLPMESCPQPVETSFFERQVPSLNATAGQGTSANNYQYQGVPKKNKKSGLTVREILQLSRGDRQLDLPPGVHSASVQNALPPSPLASHDALSQTFKESEKSSSLHVTPKADETAASLTTRTSLIAPKFRCNSSVIPTLFPLSGTPSVDSRNVTNNNKQVSYQTTIPREISEIGSISNEQVPVQTLSGTSVMEKPPSPCISKSGMPLTHPVPGEIIITKNLGLDKVEFVRRLSSTVIVMDGKVPCLKLKKINYKLYSTNLSTVQPRNTINGGVETREGSQIMTIDQEHISKVDVRLNVPLHEDQDKNVGKSQSKSKDPLKNDNALFGYTKKKIKHRGTTLNKPKATRKLVTKLKRSKSGNNYGISLNNDIDSTPTVESQCFTECQSDVLQTKRMRFSGKVSRRYDSNVSKRKPSDDPIHKEYSLESTAKTAKPNVASTPPVVNPGMDTEDWSKRSDIKKKKKKKMHVDVDNLGNWSASSESDFAFSPKRLDPNDSDWESSLEDSTPVYSSGNLGTTESPLFYENYQHMTVEEKVRLLQETKQKHEMALSALKKM